jgi:hypothetical protein
MSLSSSKFICHVESFLLHPGRTSDRLYRLVASMEGTVFLGSGKYTYVIPFKPLIIFRSVVLRLKRAVVAMEDALKVRYKNKLFLMLEGC